VAFRPLLAKSSALSGDNFNLRASRVRSTSLLFNFSNEDATDENDRMHCKVRSITLAGYYSPGRRLGADMADRLSGQNRRQQSLARSENEEEVAETGLRAICLRVLAGNRRSQQYLDQLKDLRRCRKDSLDCGIAARLELRR